MIHRHNDEMFFTKAFERFEEELLARTGCASGGGPRISPTRSVVPAHDR